MDNVLKMNEMMVKNPNASVDQISTGVNQSGVRNYNERLILTMLQRNGSLPGSDIAARSGLSPQTVSVILRKLEKDGMLARGEPVRGKVGKPSIPMMLNPDGVFSIGLKIGRRNADLLLLDFNGVVRKQIQSGYDYPMPNDIMSFLEAGLVEISKDLSDDERKRICGMGIATPFEFWKWHKLVGAPADIFLAWKGFDFSKEISEFSTLPVFVINDASAACRAEHVYGRGKEFRDYAYFFIATFVGGGVVLNNSVYEGRQGNAGALGSLPSAGPNGESRQLIDIASIHTLEARLQEVNLDPHLLWAQPQDWSQVSRYVDPWIGQTAQELAKASLSACAVIDFEAILIDGAFPSEIKEELVERTRRYIASQDTRGLIPPIIDQGTIGGNARAIGAASGPIFSQFLLNTNSGLTTI